MRSFLCLAGLVLCGVLISGCMQAAQHADPPRSAPTTIPQRSVEELYSLFDQPCYDEKNQTPCQAPSSFLGDLRVEPDRSLTEATPHWILLAAGKTEQEALLSYIEKADVSSQKRSEWSRFMMRMWMKYPVMYVKNGSSARLVPKISSLSYSPRPDENMVFQEIERYIAQDAARVLSEQKPGS